MRSIIIIEDQEDTIDWLCDHIDNIFTGSELENESYELVGSVAKLADLLEYNEHEDNVIIMFIIDIMLHGIVSLDILGIQNKSPISGQAGWIICEFLAAKYKNVHINILSQLEFDKNIKRKLSQINCFRDAEYKIGYFNKWNEEDRNAIKNIIDKQYKRD